MENEKETILQKTEKVAIYIKNLTKTKEEAHKLVKLLLVMIED